MTTERRHERTEDTGHRRRDSDPEVEWSLKRDKILLSLGSFVVLAICGVALFGTIRNPEVALAVLTVAGGLLGAPTVMRLDEARKRRNGS